MRKFYTYTVSVCIEADTEESALFYLMNYPIKQQLESDIINFTVEEIE